MIDYPGTAFDQENLSTRDPRTFLQPHFLSFVNDYLTLSFVVRSIFAKNSTKIEKGKTFIIIPCIDDANDPVIKQNKGSNTN
jgi:hypothetical protein